MDINFSAIVPSLPYILQGIWVTLQIVALSLLIGFAWGIVLALFKISRIKPLMWLADAYTSIFRGTPLVLQLLIIYFGLPQILGFPIDPYPLQYIRQRWDDCGKVYIHIISNSFHS
jgi:polar amino acid transport system permease protein